MTCVSDSWVKNTRKVSKGELALEIIVEKDDAVSNDDAVSSWENGTTMNSSGVGAAAKPVDQDNSWSNLP